MTLLETLRRTLGDQQPPLLAPGDRVLVAVSGGPDSLSLLHALYGLREEIGLGALEAAHLDHGLRGAEGAAEGAFVAAFCAERGLRCHLGAADVLPARRRAGLQDAARAARYAFLDRTAGQAGAGKIALGHTRDDRIETLLLHLLRGSGLEGLAGMPYRRGLYVRPLLDAARTETEAYCTAHGLAPRRDPSNENIRYTRSRIRRDLLPALEREYNPSVRDALWRLATVAARDADFLHAEAEAALARVVQSHTANRLALDAALLRQLHPALLRHVVRDALTRLRGTPDGIRFDHIETLCRALEHPGERAAGLTIPHPVCRAHAGEDSLTLTRPEAGQPDEDLPFCRPLPVPGEVVLPHWTVGAALEEGEPAEPAAPDRLRAVLDAGRVQLSALTVRSWRDGDRLAPPGLDGHTKKVQDLFTDARTPRGERRRVPLVADGQGILWVAGHATAARAAAGESTAQRLVLRAHRNGR